MHLYRRVDVLQIHKPGMKHCTKTSRSLFPYYSSSYTSLTQPNTTPQIMQNSTAQTHTHAKLLGIICTHKAAFSKWHDWILALLSELHMRARESHKVTMTKHCDPERQNKSWAVSQISSSFPIQACFYFLPLINCKSLNLNIQELIT